MTPSPPAAGLDGVVVGAGGLVIARRGSDAAKEGGLRVQPARPVTTPATEPTEARQADGLPWRRHWLEPGRLVVEFVDVAVVEVDDERGTIVFDRLLDPEVEEHLVFDHVLPLVLAARGALVVHGGVISLDGRGAVLLGPSGSGKSTLTAFAWSRGWTVGGDDGAVLCAGAPPTAEPTYATVRLTPTSATLLGFGSAGFATVAGKLRIHGDESRRFRQAPVPVVVLACIQPTEDADARWEVLHGTDAHAVLFASTFHAELTGHRLLREVVERLAAIVEVTTVARLAVPRGLDGLSAAERLLRDHLGHHEVSHSPPGRSG